MRPLGKGMIYYYGFSSPLGEIWIAESEEGLIKIDFPTTEDRFLLELRRITTSNPVRDGGRLAEMRRMLEGYLKGDRVTFEIPMDPKGTEFQREVWGAISRVPYGRLSSYGRIAEDIGRADAVRAVGNAVGANPLPIVIPCHRIIRGDGGLGGYGGGRELKLHLLSLEGIVERGCGWSKSRAKAILRSWNNMYKYKN